jgi:hypothetical protein
VPWLATSGRCPWRLQARRRLAQRGQVARDFTDRLWGGLDMTYYKGGGSTINGVAGGKLNNLGVGLTLGYTVNENLNLTFGYKSTVNDSGPSDMRMDGFMVTLVFGWHPIIEGMRRLKSE